MIPLVRMAPAVVVATVLAFSPGSSLGSYEGSTTPGAGREATVNDPAGISTETSTEVATKNPTETSTEVATKTSTESSTDVATNASKETLAEAPAEGTAETVQETSKEAVTKSPAVSPKKRSKPWLEVSGKLALRVVYDDNFIHYSEDDLDQFTTEPNFGKFAIDSADDFIVRPRLDLILASRSLTGKSLELRMRYSSWRYADNGVKNNESYSLRLKHPGWGRDNFTLNLYHAPMAYLRTFLDRQPYSPGSARSQYTAFSYASNTGSLAYWKRWSRALSSKWEVARSIRYYNRPFMENDNWEWRGGGYLSWRITRRLEARAEYFFSDVRARGADTEGETVESSDDGDASYERDSYKISISVSPKGGFLKVRSVSVSGQYQAYYFTSRKPYFEDPYHVGRKDQVYRTEITASSVTLGGAIVLEGGYRFTERTSSAAFDTGDENIGEDKDYTDNRVWLGVEYPF